jgi:hypothetical protein
MLDPGTEGHDGPLDADLDAEADVERILAELRYALERIRSLGSLITVCGSCKDIREVDGEWHSLEHFLQEHLGVRFSHGLCPDCGTRLLDEIDHSDPGGRPRRSSRGGQASPRTSSRAPTGPSDAAEDHRPGLRPASGR